MNSVTATGIRTACPDALRARGPNPYPPAMVHRWRARLLILLLGFWLLGQGAHDLLVHAGEWSHDPNGDHRFCSLFQGLEQVEWAGIHLPTPEGRCPEQPLPAPVPAGPSSRPLGIASRAPPLPV